MDFSYRSSSSARRRKEEARMAGPRTQTLMIAFLVALIIGVVVYFRIWSLDSSFSDDDRDVLRRQFERANLEAMDESAEWRSKYDSEVERTKQLQDELLKVKASLAHSMKKVTMMQKEYVVLQKDVESLKQKCKCDPLKPDPLKPGFLDLI